MPKRKFKKFTISTGGGGGGGGAGTFLMEHMLTFRNF